MNFISFLTLFNKWAMAAALLLLAPSVPKSVLYSDVNSGLFSGTTASSHTGGSGFAYTSGAPSWTWTTTTAMTYAFWIKIASTQNCYYFMQGSNSTAGTGVDDWSCTAGTYQFEIRNQTSGSGAQAMGCHMTTGVSDTNWHFVVATYDGSNSNNSSCSAFKIYVDNSSVALTQSGVSSITTGTTTATCPLFLGGITNSATCTTISQIYLLNGRMDMASVYFGTKLSASQAAELYCGSLGCSGSAVLVDPRLASSSSSLTDFYGVGEGSDSSSTIFDLKGSNNLTNSSVSFSTPIP